MTVWLWFEFPKERSALFRRPVRDAPGTLVDPLCRDWVSVSPAACYAVGPGRLVQRDRLHSVQPTAVAGSTRLPGSNPGCGVLVRTGGPNEGSKDERCEFPAFC